MRGSLSGIGVERKVLRWRRTPSLCVLLCVCGRREGMGKGRVSGWSPGSLAAFLVTLRSDF
jgi:hypothetical protein